MIKIFSLIIGVFVINSVSAQFDTGKTVNESVIVRKDPRFDELAAKQAEMNKRYFAKTPRRVRGFRIQAANTQNRDEANAVKAELLRRFPDQKSYLLYQAPNFRVRLGDFLTQKDAFQLRKTISALYPDRGIYIVQDIVEYTPPPEDDVEQ
ncbi:MAG TPA: SPOR domain-containing protein [Segetibacter sp.]|jgi:hypothetical protein